MSKNLSLEEIPFIGETIQITGLALDTTQLAVVILATDGLKQPLLDHLPSEAESIQEHGTARDRKT